MKQYVVIGIESLTFVIKPFNRPSPTGRERTMVMRLFRVGRR